MIRSIISTPSPLPGAASQSKVQRGLERWRSALASLGRADLDAEAERLQQADWAGRVLAALFGNSPYLTLVAEQEPAFLVDLLRDGPDAAIATVHAALAEAGDAALLTLDPGRALRICKRRTALTVALADIAGLWDLERVTGALSTFAETALDVALAYLLAAAADRGALRLQDRARPLDRCGIVVLGMGKLGGGELNYSSDIDLIVLYDPERIQPRDPDLLQRDIIRITRGMLRLMADRTADGYVFRTDLRLRPDPGATPIAISVAAAEEYYETLGQNWERAALIKAKPVAGDRDAAEMFLRWLRPFIWRRHLDFAAIQDIHSIKRQIVAYRGGGTIAIHGHNLKLGRGGIREIEFFAQTQQLIWGGRLPALRLRGTCEALAALADAGKIGPEVAADLTEAYHFLRRVEHRLQMIDDEQTHTLPETDDRLAALATFLGYDHADAFIAALLAVLRRVEALYAELFEDAPALTSPDELGGNLVFTGGETDPETRATLSRLGFRNPQAVDAAVRGWHHGRCRAMRSTRARELLTELLPHLLKALGGKPDPDAAFIAFDRFLKSLPAGVQLFSMFHANPQMLGLVTDILGIAPALADHLARRPSVLECVLSARDFFAAPPALAGLAAELCAALEQARDQEDVLDLARRWANDRKFQVGVLVLQGLLDTGQATAAWTRIAEAAVRCLLPQVEAEFAQTHGVVGGCGMAVVGMGKLGGREMTSTSDLDLIFVYSSPAETLTSDGRRPLAGPQYFARLSQRLIAAVTAPTSEGRLYEVDMRLRPSGKAGPIAVSARSFARYQRLEAWTWEQMALTRARVIAGPPGLAAEIEEAIGSVLIKPRDPDSLVADVAAMRARMAEELRATSPWDIKHRRGGLVDVEFIAQYLQLRHAHDHPGVLSTNTREALLLLREEGLLEDAVARDLLDACDLWHAVQTRIRLTAGDVREARDTEETSKLLRLAMAALGGGSLEALTERMAVVAERVVEHFREIVDRPAEAARDRLASALAEPAPKGAPKGEKR